MTYQVAVMFAVAAILGIAGTYMLVKLASATISERRTYAYRMVGIMAVSAAAVLAMSAGAMWSWSVP